LNARPHPDVDSLAPARSALRAFAAGKFLEPLPKRFESPPGKGQQSAALHILDDYPASPALWCQTFVVGLVVAVPSAQGGDGFNWSG